MANLKTILFLILASAFLTACGQSSDSSQATTATTTYYVSNGQCYNSQNGQIVAYTYCGTSTGYYLSNGYCYSSAGTIVANTYCSTTTTSTGYYLSNGICYSYATGLSVATNYCGTTTSGYYMSNGSCYSSSGQIVNSSYCSTTGTVTGIISQVCVGYYYYTNGYASQVGYCYGANCRGYTLYQYGTNQPVNCR